MDNIPSPRKKKDGKKIKDKKWRPSFKLFNRKDERSASAESIQINTEDKRARSKTTIKLPGSDNQIKKLEKKNSTKKVNPLLRPRSLAAISVDEIEHIEYNGEAPVEKVKVKPQFGLTPVELNEKFPDEPVPEILIECITILEGDIRKEGIFRIPGRMTNILEMKSSFESGKGLNVEEPNTLDIAGLVAQFFRELPEPLLMYDLYYSWIKAVKKENEEAIRESIKDMLQKIPEPNYNILKHFIEFLANVGKNSGANRMGPRNLALVFGASLLNPPAIDQYDLENIKLQCSVIEHMITSYSIIFEGQEATQNSVKVREKQVATIPAGNPTPSNLPPQEGRRKGFMKRKSTFFAISHSSNNSSRISDLITPITRSYQKSNQDSENDKTNDKEQT